MNLSSFFQGSALSFSVSGEGVAVDPETGETGLSAAALARGVTVTVRAQGADGATAQMFRLTIAAEAGVTPTLLVPPALAGSGRIGEALTVDPGTWGGAPAPALALQWLRGGAPIEGATGAAYLPGPADDGQEITCRVTAQNLAGMLAAEPAPLRVTWPAPVAVGALADVHAFAGAAGITVEAAAAFAGAALRFAAAGAGAAIDPETGRLTLATDVLRAAETVTVTATNSGGAAEARFLVTIAAPFIPPVLVAAPLIAGTGKVGSPLSVEAGVWGGQPEPAVTLQWLRDGAPIEGATGAAYVPGPEDDRCALACRVTAGNLAGSLAAETAALTVTHVAPALVGELFDEVFDQGVGPETVATAQVFAGLALGFSATGPGVAIDPATGLLTVSTDAALAGETVTVTAANSGGAASASFLLTIEAEEAEFPPMLADTAWSAREVREAAPAGRRRIEIDAGVEVPEGFELRLYSGPQAGGTLDLSNRSVTPGEPYVTSGSMAVGSTCYTLLFWRRVADGAWAPASSQAMFEIRGLEATGGTDFPAANQTLASATGAALLAALQARIAGGSTAPWVIHLPSGDYGSLDLADYVMPGRTVIRSANFPATGATVRSIDLSRAENLEFEFVKVSRVGLGFTGYPIDLSGARKIRFRFCDLDFGPAVRNAHPRGWLANATWGVRIYKDTTGNRPQDITFYMNYIHGSASKGVYIGAADRVRFEENVFADICADDIHVGSAINTLDFINNWGSRRKWPSWSAEGGWEHCDFIQLNTYPAGGWIRDVNFIGNVVLMGQWDPMATSPAQMLFASKTNTERVLYDNNIVAGNTPHGITLGAAVDGPGGGNRILHNTALRVIDDFRFPTHHETKISVAGLVEAQRNVMCALAGARLGDGLVIPMQGGSAPDYTASRAYYTNPVMAASFYDYRPVAGQPTHWAYAGDRQGAFRRFQDVIEGGRYPKIGPAAAAWKASYDPRNQIAS